MITYGTTVFATYTYSRTGHVDDTWKKANNDFNRYIQKLRRLHNDNSIQYLRTVEAHNDGYPHFHAILRFKTVLTLTNGRYFDRKLYGRWKDAWNCGHSDYQPPRSKTNPIGYIIKYISKESKLKIWKHYFRHQDATSAMPLPTPSPQPKKDTCFVQTVTPLMATCRKYKIKQVTWSRTFWDSMSGVRGKAPSCLKTSDTN